MTIASKILAWACTRKPNRVILQGDDKPYLMRWYVVRCPPLLSIYVHRFVRSDDDRALHDHPWWSLSWTLAGSYIEHYRDGRTKIREAGSWIFRRAKLAHRIELHRGEAWTLFITGPRVRRWGFWCPQGWRYWRDFSTKDGNGIDRGCD